MSPDDIIGSVEPPQGVALYDAASGGDIGLFLFLSNLIKIATVVAGIWILFNFILAGFTYISSEGNTKANQDVKNKLTYSVVGMVVIVISYIAIGLLGLLLFGRADFFLQPEICGPAGSATGC